MNDYEQQRTKYLLYLIQILDLRSRDLTLPSWIFSPLPRLDYYIVLP